MKAVVTVFVICVCVSSLVEAQGLFDSFLAAPAIGDVNLKTRRFVPGMGGGIRQGGGTRSGTYGGVYGFAPSGQANGYAKGYSRGFGK